MKHLILIHGPMGVGKTTVCRQLAMLLQPNVFLDGDWCWQMQPFVPNEENKQMALRHMTYLLNSFLDNRNFSYVLFSWVIPDEKIFQKILPFLDLEGVLVHKIALVCEPETLRQRLQKDINSGLRQPEIIPKSLSYLPFYQSVASLKIDTTHLSARETAEKIAALVQSV